jgi:tetratricopeptide (TPR) repeat protein
MKKLYLILIFFISSFLYCQESKENTEFKLAVQLYNDKLYDLALEQFKRLVELVPNTQQGIQSKYYLGLTQFQLKRFDEAKSTLQTFAVAYQQHPQAPEAWWKISECYINLKRYSDAANTYEKLKLFHPSSELAPHALLKASECYLLTNDNENAQRVLKIIIQDYGFNQITDSAHLRLAEIYLKQDLYERAIGEYKKLINESSIENIRIKSHVLLAKIYVKMGKIELADSFLNELLKNAARKSLMDSVNYELGIIYEDLGDYSKAKTFYQNLTDSSMFNIEPTAILEVSKLGLLHMAKVEAKLSEFEDAINHLIFFEEKFKSDPLLYEIWLSAAEIYRSKNDLKNSNKYYEKIIKDSAQSDKRIPYLYSALNYEISGNYSEAANYFTQFVEKYPTDQNIPETIFRIGKIFCDNLMDYRKAISRFEEILSKYPNSQFADDAQYYLSLSYENFKDFDRALQNYDELVSKFKSSEYFDLANERIRKINSFTSKNSSEGFQKLGLLLQDAMNDKPKAEIAFKIGEVYFNDLKNYKSAITQFEIALTTLQNDSLKNKAYLYKTLSLFYIALNDSSAVEKAVSEIKSYLEKVQNNPQKDDLLYDMFTLKLIQKSPQERITFIKEFLNNNVSFSKKDLVLIEQIRATLILKNYTEAKDLCNRYLLDFENSNYFEEVLFSRGYSNFILGIDSTAKADFEKYINSYPNGKYLSKTFFYLAKLFRNRKEYQKSLGFYNRIIEKYFYSNLVNDARNEIAMTYFEMGDFRSAYRAFTQQQKAVQSNLFIPDTTQNEYIYNIALSYEKLNDLDNAIKNYKSYILKNKNGANINDALFNLGLILQKNGNSDLAVHYFKQIRTNSSDLEILYKIGNLFYDNEQFGEALLKYEGIIPNVTDDRIKKICEERIIVIKYRLNNADEAQKFEKIFLEKYGKNDEYLAEFEFEKGNLLYRNKKYDEAIKIFNNIIDDYEKSDFSGWAAYWIGRYEESISQNENAIKRFEWVITSFPQSKVSSRANFALGNIYYRNEKYGDAVKYYRNVIDQKSDDPKILSNALTNIIKAYSDLGIYDAALEYCRKFIEIFPEDPSIPEKKLTIGVLYKSLKYYDQAIVHFQSLLEYPDKSIEPEIRYYMGECYFSKTDYDQAVLEFLKIPYLGTKESQARWIAAALYMAGQCYEKVNKFDQAITMYQQIIDRSGIDSTFKAQAEKEIDRVKKILLPNKD